MAPRFNVVSQLDNTAARISISELLRTAPEYRSQLKQLLEESSSSGTRSQQPSTAPAPQANLFQYRPSHLDGNLVDLTEPEAYHTGPDPRLFYTPGVTSVTRIQCKVFGMPVIAVVDSGASHSVLSQSVVRKLQLLNSVERTNITIHTANGQEEEPWGVLRGVPVTVGCLTLMLDALPVTQATNYSVLLGNDWLVQAACQMDWDTCKMRFMVSPGEYDEIAFDVMGRLRQPAHVDFADQLRPPPPLCRQQAAPSSAYAAQPASTSACLCCPATWGQGGVVLLNMEADTSSALTAAAAAAAAASLKQVYQKPERAGLAAERAVSLAACRYFSAVGTASGQVWTFGGGFNGELGGGASWSSAARPVEGLVAQVGLTSGVCFTSRNALCKWRAWWHRWA